LTSVCDAHFFGEVQIDRQLLDGWLVWCCGNGFGHFNEVTTSVSTGIGDLWLVSKLGIYPGHLGPLSLAIPLWVSAMSTRDCFSHHWEETASSV